MALTLETSTSWRERFDRAGFALIDSLLPLDQVAELIEATRICSSTARDGVLERGGEVYGVRDLIWRVSEVRRLAQSPHLLEIVEAILGAGAFAVRGLFFDKTLSTNWNLPWHQDLKIAVRARRDVAGFGPWTRKVGIPHVHAPAEYLERMVTLRLHLDDCAIYSGPMRVLPGSHTP
jgi:Phytanoyl-CoA dioxygenase (PhyH)